MQRRLAWAALPVGLIAWVACVGSDPAAPAASLGAAGENCFQNGTCIAGLACVAGICETAAAEGGVTPPTGTVPPPGSFEDAGSDGGHPADAGSCDPPVDDGGFVRCGSQPSEDCFQGDLCCAIGGRTCAALGDCAEVDTLWSCQIRQNCGFPAICCIHGDLVDGGGICALEVTNATSTCNTTANPACDDPVHDFSACDSEADCVDGTHCEPMSVKTKGNFTVLLKVCRPNPDQ